MESILNLGWLLLVIFMSMLWLRTAPPTGADRRMQLVALGVLLVILFPVISVSDDLMAARNPAEIDSSLRRDHAYASPYSVLPMVATPPPPPFAGMRIAILHMASLGHPAAAIAANPALASIHNRPPPSA
jgi:hypothetical protein